MATFYQIDLSDIENISRNELSESKLNSLNNSNFEATINNCSDVNAVCLDGSKPYIVLDGRHRVYIAKQKGMRTIRARFAKD